MRQKGEARQEKRSQKKTWIILSALVLVLLLIIIHWSGWLKPVDQAVFIRYEPGSYAVKAFRDGDTIVVNMGGVEETVRFIGVDTPETHKPDAPVQCYGQEASDYTKKRIGSSRVRLVADKLTTNRDRYNRLLRYIVLEDGTYLNYELIQKGYAFAYDFPFANSRKYNDAEAIAEKAKVGLWKQCAPSQDPITGQWHSNDL